MKKSFLGALCLVYMFSVYGQEIFKIAGQTHEKSHRSLIYTQWDMMSSAVSFAKSYGVSPYEYGKYTGNLVTLSKKRENDFADFGQRTIYYWENWRTNDDEAIYIVEETNESLVLKIPLNSMKEYFEYHNNFGVSFDEMMECIKGMEEQIAEYFKCTFKIKIEEEWSPCTTTWYPFATITVEKGDINSRSGDISSAED